MEQRRAARRSAAAAAAMLLAHTLLALAVFTPHARAQLTPASNSVPTSLESGLLTDLAGRNDTGSQGQVGDGTASSDPPPTNDTSSAADGYFDATTVIPPSQLGWLLTPPPGGWEEWAAPDAGGGGVSAAAAGGDVPEADPADLSRVRARCRSRRAGMPSALRALGEAMPCKQDLGGPQAPPSCLASMPAIALPPDMGCLRAPAHARCSQVHALLVASHLDEAALSAARVALGTPPPGSVSAAVDPTAGIPLSLPSLVSSRQAR